MTKHIDTDEVRAAIRRDVLTGIFASKVGHDALVASIDNLCAEIERLRVENAEWETHYDATKEATMIETASALEEAMARAADLDKRLTDLAPVLHAMCERAGRAEKALRASESAVAELREAWIKDANCKAIERARVAEEIAQWHDSEKEGACIDRDECKAESDRQRYRERASVHRHAAHRIRATYCKEPTP